MSEKDLEAGLEQFSSVPFRASELREASYLIGREIDSVLVFELERTEAERDSYFTPTSGPYLFRPDTVPFFKVSSKGRVADSRSISRGELSALTLLWVLKQAQMGELLLMDEPDAFLSTVASERALNLIVNRANELKTPMAASSHSYLGLSKTPLKAQVLLTIGVDGESRLETPGDKGIWTALRVAPALGVLFVVEDRVAEALLQAILLETGYPYLSETRVVHVNGGADVLTAARYGRLGLPQVTIRAVNDGDLPGDAKSEPSLLEFPSPMSLGISPEATALKLVEELIDFEKSSREQLLRHLETTVGLDPHNRAQSCAEMLGLTVQEFVVRAWMMWFRSSTEGRAQLDMFGSVLSGVLPQRLTVDAASRGDS
ncbi:hypothetical protein IFT72_01600 [Frigoribacterium sp. CFBP 8754]|uniref:hypothetical protein n=1 Tax=Frigoribacterium sp. CFBP 8754 TaxID=2775290 RepID=UPI0017808581|nr:hypothetical protein [Frigoribacterium sp. CFBP 8754]MBD8658885.1 hypothetical protein [Frigoribacterium sp. CFBP 8754]